MSGNEAQLFQTLIEPLFPILFILSIILQIYLLILFINLCKNTKAIRTILEKKEGIYSWDKK
jgi:hypothetical protein